MPELAGEELKMLLNKYLKNTMSITLNASSDEEEKALKICEEYINNGNIDIHDMSPLSIYYIISKLPDERQIEFIQENINYIKENDEEIFLYKMLAPKSLSYFLSLKVLKTIRTLDRNLLKKIIDGSQENLFHGFNHEDYIEFYNEFFDVILEMDNRQFINAIYLHNRCCYDNNHDIDNLNSIIELQPIYNKDFIEFLLKKYKDKISTFTSNQMLKFITYIENLDVYKLFINENYDKLNEGFKNFREQELIDYLSETDGLKQEMLIPTFLDNIIKKQDINKIVFNLKPNIVIELYNKNKEVFNTMTFLNWIKFCSISRIFNEDFKKILDRFEINDIESLFDTNFFNSHCYKRDVRSLKYIEEKYRESIRINGFLEQIDEDTSIFAEKYFKNLKEIREKLKNNNITKSDKQYKILLSNFILFLKKQDIINNIEGNNFKEIERLFYRIVMGASMTIVYQLSSIEEITLFNRIGYIDFDVKDFTVEQLEKYNVKQHKQLYKQFDESNWHIRDYKKLILKLIFMVGFNCAKSLLEIDDTIPVLEHLVGNVDVKNVILNEQGDPVLNTKIMNLLFSDKGYSKIKEMLFNQDNDLYKYFPRIFSEWEMIRLNGKDKTLNTIIDFLKSDEISIPPDYYRLVGLFKFIGCNNSIVNETLSLHDQMLKRNESSIPRIIGIKDGYLYEILRLDDMEGLVVGNKTDCCFTVLGNGYSCLKHAVTSRNGRILVIKKNNKILAHSWVWRNGDLLCLDNIEISKTISQVDFFEVYLQLADEIIEKSFKEEGLDNCIKNITIGFTNFDKKINGIENYPCLISKSSDLKDKNFENKLGQNRRFVDVLPQPVEEVEYSDSKNVQYIIRGTGKFKLGQIYHSYKDETSKETKCMEKPSSRVLTKK